MPGTSEIQEIEIIIEDIGGGGGTEPPAGGDGEGGDKDRRRRPEPPSARRYYTAMALAIVSILMFFMALASAFLVREAANDWIPVHMPAVIWVNTIVLLASSATMELARKLLARGDAGGFRSLWQ